MNPGERIPALKLSLWVYISGAIVLLLHLLTNSRYGFHRDELYMLDCGNHLDWGFYDMPPLVPFLGKISTSVFGVSLAGLRVLPALIHTLLVLLTAGITRDLGGNRKAQILAAASIAVTPVLLVAGNQFQTIPFDQLFWLLLIMVFIRIIFNGESKYWIAFGCIAGLAFEAKYLILVLVFAMGIAILAERRFSLLKSRYFYMGVALAVLLALPNLIWQVRHQLPVLEHVSALRDDISDDFSVPGFLKEMFLVLHPVNFLFILAGAVYFFHREKKQRILGIVFFVTLITYLITGARSYYMASAIPIMIAGASILLGNVSGLPRRHWIYPAVLAGLILPAVLTLPVWLPVLSVERARDLGIVKIRYDFQEMTGWEELAEQVSDVYRSLSPKVQAGTLIVTGNYGEAGAINLYGKPLGLPEPACTLPSYHHWGYSPADPRWFLFVGYPEDWLRQYFDHTQQKAVIENPYRIDNEERGMGIVLCSEPKQPFEEIWTLLRHY